MTTTYEWKVEFADEYGDIQDYWHFSESEFDLATIKANEPNEYTAQIALVREVGNDEDGLTDRQHAYVEDGKLPDCFEYGAKIPARFYEMVKRAYQ